MTCPVLARHKALLPLFERIEAAGHFANKAIVLADPDQRQESNTYEDLDLGEPADGEGQQRFAVVTLRPEYDRDLEDGGDGSDSQERLTHARALGDMRRVIDRFGYVLVSIGRDKAPVAPSRGG